MWRALNLLAYLTISGTAPWIAGGAAVGVVALPARARSPEPATRGMLLALAVIAFVFAALAVLVLAASRACEGAGGCSHSWRSGPRV
jgi:hypothetical protein